MFLQALVYAFLWFNLSTADRHEGLHKNDKNTKNVGCNNTYKVIHLELFPYSDFPIEDLFKCGTFVQLKYNNSFNKLWLGPKDIDKNLFERANLIYPVLSRNEYELYKNNFEFLPVLKHAGFTYVTQIEMSSFEMAIESCLDMYPLFIISCMMSILFGFIVWIFETLQSKEDYPRSFPIGWLKGMWWSMATMISTGPESTPKSVIGRILALIWLIIAVIMISLITSIVTAAMVKPFPTPSMSGALVGSLRFEKYNKLEILRHNGKMKEYPGSDMYEELSNLLDALRKKELDGVLVDKYILRNFLYRDWWQKREMKTNTKHYDYPYVLTDIQSDGSMAYGLLIAYRGYSFDNLKWLNSQIAMDLEILLLSIDEQTSFITKDMQKKVNTKTGPLVFTMNEQYVKDVMKWLAVMIGIGLFVGLVYEIVRKKVICFTSDKESTKRAKERQGELA